MSCPFEKRYRDDEGLGDDSGSGSDIIGSRWIPIVGNQRIEPFVSEYFMSSKDQTVSIVTTIFTIIACMIIAAFLGIVFYWSYHREVTLFIAILCSVTLAYSIMNVIYFSVKSDQIEQTPLRIYLGSSIFVAILNIVLIIYFSVVAREKMRGSGSDSGSGYAPPSSMHTESSSSSDY